MKYPFIFVGHGKIKPESIGKEEEAMLVLKKKPTEAVMKKIEKLCPQPLSDFYWKGAVLTAVSENDGFDMMVEQTYGSGSDDGTVSFEAVDGFMEALEKWVKAVHKIAPLEAVLAPGSLDAFDEWDEWSRAELSTHPVKGLEKYATKPLKAGTSAESRAHDRVLKYLKKFDKAIRDLKLMDLSGMGLSSLPPQIFEYPISVWLMLDENQFTTIPPEVAKFKSLKKLIVRGNPLESLPEELTQLPLKSLELGNSMAKVKDASVICKMTNLEELDIRGLQTIPACIGGLTKLKNICVGSPNLKGFEVLFSMPSLEVLQIVDSGLEEIPAEIGNLKNLKSVYLNGNKLKRLPKEMAKLEKLRDLGLKGNPLPGLAAPLKDLFDARPKVEEVFKWIQTSK